MSSSFDGNDPRCLLARLAWYGCAVIAWNRLREEIADEEIFARNCRLDALLGGPYRVLLIGGPSPEVALYVHCLVKAVFRLWRRCLLIPGIGIA